MEQPVNSGDIADMKLKINSQERHISALEDIIYKLYHAIALNKKEENLIKEFI